MKAPVRLVLAGAFAALFAVAATDAAAQKAKSKDNPKCQPNPVFEKFPGAFHSSCDRSRFLALELQTAKDPAKLDSNFATVNKEGEYWYYFDEIDKDASGSHPSPLELQVARASARGSTSHGKRWNSIRSSIPAPIASATNPA